MEKDSTQGVVVVAKARPRGRLWLWVLFGALVVLVTPFVALLTVSVVAIGWRGNAARVATTSAKLSMVESMITNYQLDTNSYPAALNALVPKYLRSVPMDDWQRPFVYVVPGAGGAPFDLYSMGTDGVAGNGDDVRVGTVVPVAAPVAGGR